MLRVTLWHEPEDFAFYIQDPECPSRLGSVGKELRRDRFATGAGVVVVGVKSEYTAIPITVEFDKFGAEKKEEGTWDRIVECALTVSGRAIAFEASSGEEFGRLEVDPGTYRLRIYFGGQQPERDDGESEDFYLIQCWPSGETESRILKSSA